MSLSNITESVIRQYAGGASYERGRDYYRSGAVDDLVQRGEVLEAEVEGSGYAPYAVRITTGKDGPAASCTCPYDYEGWCKHIVAVLLTYIHDKEMVDIRPDIGEQLTGLDRDQLHRLLLALVERHPGLTEDIEIQLPLMQSAAPSSDSVTAPLPEINAKHIRRQVRSALHSLDRMSGSEAYWHVGGVVSEIEALAQKAKIYIDAGDGRNAITILEAVTDEYVDDWTILDGSDGDTGEFFLELGALWTEAILSADLSEEERETWAETLQAWQAEVADYGIENEFEPAIYAAKQGWDYAPLKRVLSGKAGSRGAWSGEAPWCANELTRVRLGILERQERYQEYLYLAEAEGQMGRYVNMLVRQGDIQKAMEKGLESLNDPQEILTVAQTLYEGDHSQEALHLGEHGLSVEAPPVSEDDIYYDDDPLLKYDLACWVSNAAEENDNPTLALKAAEVAFTERPDLELYSRLQTLAGNGWPALRDDLLKGLRESEGYHPEGQVDVFLHENLADDAINTVAEYGFSYDLIRRVMDAVVDQRPEWVVQAAKHQAERIIDAGKADRYHHAVNWLERVRTAYRVMDREQDWKTYFAEIRTAHHRKYKLMGLLEALD